MTSFHTPPSVAPAWTPCPCPATSHRNKLERILGDVASLSVKWSKPLTARLLPVAGKHARDRTDFADPRLINATLQPLP